LSSPPKVIDEAPTVAVRPAASSPPHFQVSVARSRSRAPSRVAVSSPAMGGSGLRCSPTSVMAGESTGGRALGWDAPNLAAGAGTALRNVEAAIHAWPAARSEVVL